MWYRGGGGWGLGANLRVAGAEAEIESHARAVAELAKSGAASCRTCRKKIAEGSVRVCYGGGKYVHVRCWKGPENQRVRDDYFAFDGALLSEEQQASLAAWVVKHNAKVTEKAEAGVPQLGEKAVSVTRVAAAPVAEDASKEASFSRLSNDTMVYLFSFLSDTELGCVERVSKAFLRAAGKEWKNCFDRFQQLFDADKFGTHKRAYLMGVCHGCLTLLGAGGGAVFIKSIGRSVCAACVGGDKRYSCVAKKYLKDYGLTERDVVTFRIPKEKRPNPYGRNLAPMTVFLVHDLMVAAEKKAKGIVPAKKKAKK